MKVLLIEPPMQSIMMARADWFPMSLGYLAGAVLQAGHHALIYNGEHDVSLDYLNLTTYTENYNLYLDALKNPKHSAWDKVRKVMHDYKPDLVGITSFSVKIPSARRVAAISKDLFPGIPVIMGGQHATIMTDEVLRDSNIDFVARGEGENTLIEFISELENDQNWGEVDGLCYRRNDKIIINTARALEKDLDKFAFPARETLHDLVNYPPHALGKLFSTRGCPYHCTYCGTQNIWTHKLRVPSVQKVIDEINHVKSTYNCKNFTFMDDVFAVHKKFTLKLTDAMIEEKLNVKWDCLTRANLIDDKILSNMKKAGCTKIDMGVESGSDKILLDTKKGVSIPEITKASATIRRHGIFLYMFFMLGLPTETEDDVKKSKALIKKLKPDWVGISIFTPIPGTEAYNDLMEQGLISKDPDYAKFSHQSPDSNFAFNMTDRNQFPKLASDMIEYVQGYNGSWRHLIRRGMTRGYHRNPKLLISDLKKLATWKGLLKSSHQGSHAKFYTAE